MVEAGFVKQMADKTNGYGELIVRDKRICGGEPVFKGTRVTLRTVLASLAAGEKVEKIPRAISYTEGKTLDPGRTSAFAAAVGWKRIYPFLETLPRAMKIKLDENLPLGLVISHHADLRANR